jgi:hypothetical protein
VYAITSNDNDEILYVGKNKKKTIFDRAWQHVNAGDTSDLKSMVTLYPTKSQDVSGYQIRWIEIVDPRERYFFEMFAIGVLRPKMNYKRGS